MNISMLLFTDGRAECFARTFNSFMEHSNTPLSEMILIDDSANPRYADMLNNEFGGFFTDIIHHPMRRGFAGAIQSGWDVLAPCDFVFHLEDDFTFNAPLELESMATVLTERRWIAQMVLKRQAWNGAEKEAGGIVELNPDEYTQQRAHGATWTEHRRNFSTNPCLYPYALIRQGFPQKAHDNERIYSEALIKQGFRFAFWGGKFDPPRVEHIGKERVGVGY